MTQTRLNPIPGPIEDEPTQGPPPDRDIFGRTPVGRPDWSHRRGEPRVLALLWMLYLMGVTILMFSAFMDALSISPDITRPAAQNMIVATMLGIMMFYPALRLSQRPADRPVRGVLGDLFVLLVPAQAVIWPHALDELAGWPMEVLLATACSMAAWAVVAAGIVALGDATRPRIRGWWWMLVAALVVVAVPVWAALTGTLGAVRPDVPRYGWMLSPVTSMLELTRSRDALGHPIPVYPTHWRLIAGAACAGVALLLVARAVEVASRRRNP